MTFFEFVLVLLWVILVILYPGKDRYTGRRSNKWWVVLGAAVAVAALILIF